ncbi:methyltransferase family protein [Bacteroidota bacterium]
MLPLPNIIVLVALSCVGLSLILSFARIAIKGGSLVGKPSANSLLFYSVKLSIFISIGLFLGKAIFPSFGGVYVPEWMAWLGAGMVTAGSFILVLSFFSLSSALKYGLPEENTQLKTTGLFRFSRNPLYVGLFLVNIASAIFFPAILNILVSAYCILIHLILIRGEEKFLEERFGVDWIAYKKRVRRFI